jgi:predicted site-specific integrase-resolvase
MVVDMKLSQYAKKTRISYKAAWRWYKAGTPAASHTPNGMVVVRDR